MRILAIALAGACLMLPSATPSKACQGASATAAAVDLSAEKMKKPPKKKVAIKKEKVEYMRAAPMPPGAK